MQRAGVAWYTPLKAIIEGFIMERIVSIENLDTWSDYIDRLMTGLTRTEESDRIMIESSDRLLAVWNKTTERGYVSEGRGFERLWGTLTKDKDCFNKQKRGMI
jgi:hypothetical protein